MPRTKKKPKRINFMNRGGVLVYNSGVEGHVLTKERTRRWQDDAEFDCRRRVYIFKCTCGWSIEAPWSRDIIPHLKEIGAVYPDGTDD